MKALGYERLEKENSADMKEYDLKQRSKQTITLDITISGPNMTA
jgi:hypothetical protein